ncbi:DUF1572 family protein [Marinoscillum furvescens]|uniref:Uncharacterized protein DUF1572 n=1 Tax=Marinoscillum furvescens DSM 4134 TaxID=1122208 RepID=A0A3D9KXI8_MARFU|nr:DUF1572 family protein [Marinoscillum furvescens]RED92475.1 uncharacterized protein DUF1572 [Marinoscillum furvescens DSM 4134]
MTQHLAQLFVRDLDRLATELENYTSEEQIWKVAPGTSNSAGVLAKHLIGNLNHFVGAILGNTGYVRNREEEFTNAPKPVTSLLRDITDLKDLLTQTLAQLDEQQLAADYPLEVFGAPIKTDFFLIHLQGHLNYHLGQINYHRRLLATDK